MLGKLCAGTFSDTTRQTLAGNRNRAQWQMYPCEECRLQVGARLEKGTWLPDIHWQSITYAAHPKKNDSLRSRSKQVYRTPGGLQV